MSERTPLLGETSSTADGSSEARFESRNDPDPTTLPESDDLGAGEPPSGSLSVFRITVALVALGVLIFLQATNVSLLTTTQSNIAEDLQAPERASWFTSAYLIAISSLSPLIGRLAIIFTPRICISVGCIIFAVGTFITGLAPDFSFFIVGRVICGIGAAAMLNVATILVIELSTNRMRGLSIGLLNAGFTLGIAVGAAAAGALLPLVGWRWLFLGQSPLAALGSLALYLTIPKNLSMAKQSQKPMSTQLARLDYLGAILLTSSLVLMLYPLSSPGEIPRLPLLLSPLFLALFVLVELRFAHEPIIPITLLRSRGLLMTCLSTVGFMTTRWSVLFYTPLYALALRGWSPGSAGSILVPTNAGYGVGGLIIGWLHIRRQGSFYAASLVTYVLYALTFVWLSTLMTSNSDIRLFILDITISGFVTGAGFNYSLAHVLHLTPKSTHYITTSLLTTSRGFSASFGSAIGGGYFGRALKTSLVERFAAVGRDNPELVRRLLGSPALVQKLTGADKAIAMAGYADALRALFNASAVLAVTTILAQAAAGWKGPSAEETVDDLATGNGGV